MTERFEEVYRQHVGSVFRFAVHCVGRRDIAEEITSEAFLALFRNFEGIDTNQLPGWLITVARNRARDHWRRTATEQKYLDSVESHSEPGQDPVAYELFLSPALRPIHRVCLTLRFVEGMTRSEIAREIGLTETQVKGHLQYSLQLLRKGLDPGVPR